MVRNINSTIGFERQIWDATCLLRGNIDALEYRPVVLGLIFLKYVSDKFEIKHQELVAEGAGYEEDPDEYLSSNVLFVPDCARWSVIAQAAHTPQIGVVIDQAMIAIEEANRRFKDILPKDFARPELDKRRLGNVVDVFSNISMVDHGKSQDILGRTYEYCLSQFAADVKQKGGEFYTPACIVKILVDILQPYCGRVYDPCCGSGGMFVQSAKFLASHGGNINRISVFGQESNPNTWKLAHMNLAIHGIDADLGNFSADSFFNDIHPQLKADFIMANPPFNISSWGQEKLLDDERWKYGIPPACNANFAWVQHMIWHLSPTGRIGVVLPNGSLSSSNGGEDEIRKQIVNDDLVECIISLPSHLFYTTTIPVSLWFLARKKIRTGKTLFIDARCLGKKVFRTLRVIKDDEVQKLVNTYNAYVNGSLEDKVGFCATVGIDDIAKHGFILTPSRYVGFKKSEQEQGSFEDDMTMLTQDLFALFHQNHQLEDDVREQLKILGFEE